MRRALILLNLYGREAVRHKLKKGRKTLKMHFLPVLELMSDSLTAIYVEQNQCPSHQSILLTQEPIHGIFAKIFRELAILKNKVFFGGHFEIFFFKKKNFFLLHSHVKRSKFLGQQGWVEILMITLVSSCFLPWTNILDPSVYI